LFKFKTVFINNLFSGKDLIKVYYLFALIITVSILELFGLASIAPFLGLVTDPDLVNKHSLIHFVYSTLGFDAPKYFIAFLGSIFLVSMITSSILSVLLSWKINIFVQNTTARLSQALFRHYVFMPYSFHLDTHSSVISKNILNEVARAVELVVYPFLIALSKICLSIFITVLLILVDPILALLCCFTFSVYYLLTFGLLKNKVDILGKGIAKAISLRFKVVSESIAGIKELKLEGKEEEYISFFKKPSQDFAELIVSSQLRATLPKVVIEVLSFGLITIIIIYLSINVPSSGKRVSLIALYGFSAYRLIPALHIAYESLIQVRFNFSALENLSKQLYEKHKKHGVEVHKDEMDFSKIVKLTDVSYRYPGAKVNAVENISLEFGPADHIGLVGESGSGKSTLIDVLLGLLELSSGEMSLGKVKLCPENISRWQECISYVPQNIFLFDGSIEQNIAFEFGSERIDRERVSRAIQLSALTDFVSSLPNRESSLIGERGVKLSGGQRQRIGIARALYKKSNIIILDEATSAIDSVSESKVTQSLETLQDRPTIITITHRISVLKNCNVIYVMRDGQFISSGSFEYLLKNCQYFRNLSNLLQIPRK